MTLQIKTGMTKSQNMQSLAWQNSFGPEFVHSLLRLVKGTTKPNTLLLNGLHSLIDSDGLHLLVCHLFAVPVLVLWVGLENKEVNN